MPREKSDRRIRAPRLGHASYRRERWMWNGRRRRKLGDETAAFAPPAPAAAPAEVAPQETPLQKAERVMRSGEAIVERQKQLLLDLRRNGRSTDAAEKLLHTFQEVLLEYRKNLAMQQIRSRRGGG